MWPEPCSPPRHPASSSDVCLAADQGDSFNLLKLPYRIFLSLCDGRFSGYMLLPKRVPNGNFLPSRFQWNHSLACFCVSCHFWIKIDNFYWQRGYTKGVVDQLLLNFYVFGDFFLVLATSSSIRNISMEDISSFKNKRSWLGPSGKLFSFIRPKTFFLSQYKDCSKEATLLMSIALSWRSISISSNKAFLFFHKHLYLFISHCKYTKYNDIQKLSG